MPSEVAALVEQADEAAAIQLAELAEGPDKAVAKAARRGLYMLKLAGIMPPPLPVQSQPFEQAPAIKQHAEMTTMDGGGNRMLLFLRDDPYGGSPKVATFLLHTRRGIKDAGISKIPRRKLDEFIQKLNESGHTTHAVIPLDYARHVLKKAAEITRLLPDGATQVIQEVGPPDAEYPRPLIYEYLNPDLLKEDFSFSREPQRMFESLFFKTWLLEPDVVVPWAEKLRESQETRLVLNESQLMQRAERIIDDATDAVFDKSTREDYRYRLEETALVLYLADRKEEAKEALYHALSLRDGIPPHAIPFARHITRRTLMAIIADEVYGEEKEKPGLIYRV
ncbi:MAG TPA: hypothetical protein VNJ09_11405 [Chthonomonadales bacterium]|nr:hypothetical protein [Chthonomonadales bacterium]